ncbi:hypothetical protein A4V15_14980 [Pseudomonas oryzihabitans]|uniref:Uncharacterized protein n=1 Tax=Pseudomonas oryzihabitans TaxID=47885 RepID=A0A178LK63_9PSED|nr:hypothetical protein A4V15_14980 [Pseudomonas oryzihabitans]
MEIIVLLSCLLFVLILVVGKRLAFVGQCLIEERRSCWRLRRLKETIYTGVKKRIAILIINSHSIECDG